MSNNTAGASDKVEAIVTKGKGEFVAALSNKTSLLHKIVSEATHLGDVAWADIESVVAEIKFMLSFGQSEAAKVKAEVNQVETKL